MVGYHSSATGAVLPLEFQVGNERKTVTLPSRLTVNGADTYRVAAFGGTRPRAIAALCGGQLTSQTGELIECLTDTPPSPTPIYVLYPRSRQLSLRVRVFIDWLAREYARQEAPEAATRRIRAEAHRQSRAVAGSSQSHDDQSFIDAARDRGDE